MDIRVLTYGYNEIKMLPLKLAWCKHHKVQMVYFDNESTDGSREWAIENQVFAGDIKTDGAFDIVEIMYVLNNYRGANTYDWSIVAGVDLFFQDASGALLSEIIPSLYYGYDAVMANYAMICRTDNVSSLDFSIYHRYNISRDDLILIAKQNNQLGVDSIQATNPTMRQTGWWFNFGHTKSKQERMETYERRKKAWANGLNKGYGNHYRMLASTDFTTKIEHTESIHEDMTRSMAYHELCELLNELQQ